MSRISCVKNNVKTHLKGNKVTYIACGTTAVVVAGVTYVILAKTRVFVVNDSLNVSINSPKTNIVEVFIEALGDPGNIIQHVESGTVYASQGQAARELGLSAAAISKHLNGLSPNVKGHEFVKLAKATASE